MLDALVSCIIPVHNGERYLREAIDSIFKQTYRPLEIIVIDDGSTDGTARVAASYGDQLHYEWQPNAGPAAARNKGLDLARRDFVAFLDADDLWHPDKLTRQMARFEARAELGWCVTHSQNFWVPELQEEAERYKDHRISQPMPGYVTSTLLARSRVFETVGPFDIKFGHGDKTEWFIRATERGIVTELLPDVLLYRRLHTMNRSRIRASRSCDEYLQILKGRLDRRRLNGTNGH
jgi:glycosyltransferase involved in cell wall biosynthesis